MSNETFAEKCKKIWNRDAEIREEFSFTADGDMEQAFKDFVMFKKLENNGHIRVLGEKRK